MRKRRGAALLLALALVMTALPVKGWADEASSPYYELAGGETESGYELEIYLHGANAVSGKIAVKYDASKLELAETGRFTAAVKAGAGVTVTTQGLRTEEVLNAEEGYVLVAWYPSGTRLDAREEGKLVCSIPFLLAEGESVDGSSFMLYEPERGTIREWNTVCSVFGDEPGASVGVIYRYNEASSPQCLVERSYAGVEQAGASRTVRFQVSDILGRPVRGTVTIGGREYETGINGALSVELPDGGYSYRVTAQEKDMETRLGRVEVSGDTLEVVQLESEWVIAEQAAQELKISYAQGDSASHVTAPVGLPAEVGGVGKVSWRSSNGMVVDRYGGVFPTDSTERVTLTATVTVGRASYERSFTLTVLPRAQQNPDPVYPDVGQPEEPEPGEENSGGNGSGGTGGSGSKPKEEFITFDDLDGYDWAAEAILILANNGVIGGTGKGTYSPRAQIKRGDYLLLLMNIVAPGAEAAGEEFTDVPEGSYYHNAIVAARGLGITAGIGGNRFEPEASITRQEMAALASQAMKVTGLGGTTAARADLSAFTDEAEIAPWARETLSEIVGRGLMVGNPDGRLNPRGNTTRAEAAVFLYGIYLQQY